MAEEGGRHVAQAATERVRQARVSRIAIEEGGDEGRGELWEGGRG